MFSVMRGFHVDRVKDHTGLLSIALRPENNVV